MLSLYGQTNAQQDTKYRFGATSEFLGITGNKFLVAGAAEYKYTTAKYSIAQAHIIVAQLQLGFPLGDNVQALFGGGYEHNISYKRGQAFLSARLNTGIVMASGKYLFAKYGYKNNYEASLTLFPGQGVFGFGGTFQTEYECNVISGKFVIRFNGGASSQRGSSRSSSGRTCFICGF